MSPTSGIENNSTPGSDTKMPAVPTATNTEQEETKVLTSPPEVSGSKEEKEEKAITFFGHLDPVPRFGSPTVFDYDESPPAEPPVQVVKSLPAQVENAPPAQVTKTPSTLNATNTGKTPAAAAYHSNFVRMIVV